MTPPGSDTSSSIERITSNDARGKAVLSICIPTWQDDAKPLLDSLSRLDGIENCEVLVYDDGSCDTAMTASVRNSLDKIAGPAKLITASENRGRSYGRNRLITHAATDWILLLDADMLPDDNDFLRRYLSALTDQPLPALISGGFSLKQVTPDKSQALHAAQSRRSECLTADERQKAPGQYVFTSNVMVHRDILQAIEFDDGFEGWGWEDVDWGLRVAEQFPVRHIDNTATHLGLDQTSDLIAKYCGSAKNFARLIDRHPSALADMKLKRAATKLKHVPGGRLARPAMRALAEDRLGIVPMNARLFALKLLRASVYSEAL